MGVGDSVFVFDLQHHCDRCILTFFSPIFKVSFPFIDSVFLCGKVLQQPAYGHKFHPRITGFPPTIVLDEIFMNTLYGIIR